MSIKVERLSFFSNSVVLLYRKGGDIMNDYIRDMLRSLSVTGNYHGYIYIMVACELILEDETRLFSIMNKVYARVAEICNCEMHSVERNIRTVIFQIWNNQRARLCEIAGYSLSCPPTVSEFLAILTSYARITANA